MLKTRNKVSPDFNMSSMTDLVFLLLIFFMLTSNFVTSSGLPLNLPSAKGQVVADKHVTISISKELMYYIDSDIVSIDEMPAKLAAAIAGQEAPTVILNADKNIPLDNVVKVMSIVKELNAKMILATNEAE